MSSKRHILIVGAGEAGLALLDEFRIRGRLDEIAGLADDDPAKAGLVINGKVVLGSSAQIQEIIHSHEIDNVIIAMPSSSYERLNRIVSLIMGRAGVHIHILPKGEKYFDSVPLLPALQQVSVSDLLDRDEYNVDISAINKRFENQTVLITGAGGSIGSEICRQLLKFNVKRIIAIGHGEHSIYELIKSMNEYMNFMTSKPVVFYRIIDVKDASALDMLFNEFKPDIVFHAAAHKHVPLMEYNELEALKNNVGGTANVLSAASKHGTRWFTLVSTDKAVRPSNIMGATKRLAEMVSSYYLGRGGMNTLAVRFGNVLGSSGSVIPLFEEQIRRGGPVTVTHPDVRRYFMSISEAALLVINATALSEGGETFVLDMGQQYKIADIARRLIEMHGLVPEVDICINYTGLRPGEKLYEEVFHDDKELSRTGNNKILVKKNNTNVQTDGLREFLENTINSFSSLSAREVRELLKKLVVDYNECSKPNEAESAGKYIN